MVLLRVNWIKRFYFAGYGISIDGAPEGEETRSLWFLAQIGKTAVTVFFARRTHFEWQGFWA